MKTAESQLKSILCFIFLVSIICVNANAQTPNEPQLLQPNQPIERQIKGGEIQVFQFNVKASFYARTEVVPTNIDVVVSLFDADGKLLIEMDGDSNYLWREAVSVIAEKGGNFKLQIKGKGTADKSGSYTVKIAELRKSIATDRKRIEAEQLLVQAIKIDQQNKWKESSVVFEKSLNLWREIGDKYWESVTMMNLAYASSFSGDEKKALALQNQAVLNFQDLKDKTGESFSLGGIGFIYRFAKNYEQAKEYLEKSLIIRKELKRTRGEYNLLQQLIVVYYKLNQSDKVLESHNRMLVISKELKDRGLEAAALKGIGDLYWDDERYVKMVEYYEQALPIYQELKNKKSEIFILRILGLIYGQSNQYEKARDYLEQVAALEIELNKKNDWDTFRDLGLVYNSINQSEKALDYYEKALTIAKTLNDNHKTEGFILSLIGGIYSDHFQQYDKAKVYLQKSLTIAREVKNQTDEGLALDKLALVYVGLGQFDKAIEYSQESLVLKHSIGKVSEALAFSSLGLIYLQSAKYGQAKESFEKALAINKELEDKNGEGQTLGNLALLSSFLGQTENARDYYNQSLIIAKEQKNRRNELSALNGLGSAYSALSQFEKAKDYYEQALAIAKELKERGREGSILNSLGSIYIGLSQYEKAKDYQEQALIISREVKNRLNESVSLISLGRVHANLNQYDIARDYYEQGLKISIDLKSRLGEYDALINLGYTYINLNQYDKGRDYLEKANALSKEIKTKSSEIDVLVGFGAISSDLNKFDDAVNLYQQSLGILKELKNRRGEGILLNALGDTYKKLKQYDKAQGYFGEALAIATEVKNLSNESNVLINLGEVYFYLNQSEKSQNLYEKGLDLARKVKNRSNESYALNGLGELFVKLDKLAKAEDYFQQALAIAKEIKSKKLEGTIQSNLMGLYKKQNKPQIAIIYGKQAINVYQEIRGNIKGFDKDSQQSYLKDKETAYRTLADILISQERFPEAQTVLNLLKEEEYSQLARTDVKGDKLPYSNIEADLLDKIENLVGLERQRDELLKIKNRTTEQETQAKDLLAEITKANDVLDFALKELAKAENSVGVRVDNFKQNNNLKGALTSLRQRTNSGVVALYTLLGKEEETGAKKNPQDEKTKFGWVILVTEKGQKAYPIDVTDFNQTVFQFRDALSSDKYDPRPLAQKIYNAIFRQKSAKQKRTLEQDLQEYLGNYPNKTLMWSLDGVLRYIPMAALHDGKNYLAEKYLNAIFTEKSISSLQAENLPNWTVLGLGVSEQREDFVALPGVKIELETIVREETATTGILNGAIKLNENFKKEFFYNAVSEGYPVIHIASHYSFKPTAQKDSFLLVGDGHLTFGEMFDKDKNLFGAVDLLTLSACETGVSGNGTETEGFPYKAQELGAKSVIASLWKVSDAGTPELMTRFYQSRKDNPMMSKGEAFRRAQLSLLKGKVESEDNSSANRTGVFAVSGKKIELPLFVKDEKKPFAHPHYWASFVLIGNWR